MLGYRTMRKPRFNPILFDLDGTLVDSGKDIALAANRTLAGMGLPMLPEKEIIGQVGDGVRRLMEYTLHPFDNQDVDEAVRVFRADYRLHCLEHTRPYPGILELLRDLRGHSVGVVTNKPADFSHIILEGLGLSALVDCVVGGDETEHLKPLPDPLLLACQRLQRQPDSGIMIGDHLNDIASGRAAGMYTCGVLWGLDQGVSVRAAAPDHLCASVLGLRTVVLGP